MRIKRRHLNNLIESLLNEVGLGVGMDPTGSTMPAGIKRSEYNQLKDASSDPHNILAVLSAIDPTLASDIADAILYYIEGYPEEAALVLALSAGGLGAGALAVKLGKGFKAAGKNADEAAEMAEDLAEKAIKKSKSMLDLEKQLEYLSNHDPGIKSAIRSGHFVKVDLPAPAHGLSKPDVPNITARVGQVVTYGTEGARRSTSIKDEYNAMQQIHKLLPNNSVKPIKVGKANIDGRQVDYLVMKKFESGSTLNDIDLKNLSVEELKSMKDQITHIGEKLKSAGITHGDLQSKNMWYQDGKVIVFDPAGLREGERLVQHKKRADSKKLNSLIRSIDIALNEK